MHPNRAFRRETEDRAIAMARARSFGILSTAAADGLLAAHIPFLLDDAAGMLEAHLLRSNPIARALRHSAMPAMMIVSGPDGYVSPDWYGEDDKVPTWNYVAVHLRGMLCLAEDVDMRGHVDRLSAQFEGRLSKTAWTADKMTPDLLEAMMRTIVPVRMTVEGVESTFKLNQNRSDQARRGAARMIAAGCTPGHETAALAALMRAVPGD
ncbi:MAG: FMN-binding negative transcriptional regulator [Pseudomonadota bacterium]